jgi:hypothetical protein
LSAFHHSPAGVCRQRRATVERSVRWCAVAVEAHSVEFNVGLSSGS